MTQFLKKLKFRGLDIQVSEKKDQGIWITK